MKEVESAKQATAPAEPLYCPAVDWKKALALVQETPEAGPGAHRLKLSVSFAAVRARAEIQYAPITPQAIDADHASLDNKPVELLVTETRSSSNQSIFPEGMTDDDYAAYSVATVGDVTRTRIAILVRLDTTASKVLNRVNTSDKLRIRGTARVPANPSALSIVVDSAGTLES